MIKESVTYITKVEECPYCLKKIKFHSLSKDSVRDSIKQLYEHMNSHFDECEFKKLNDEKQLVKVSINTKKNSEKLYSSCFDTHQLLVG
jgi:hypothetical protein